MKNLCFILIGGFLLSGCTYLASVSTTSIPAQRMNKVTAQGQRTIVLGFNLNNDYVDSITEDLAKKCPGGKVMGILTKHEDIVYFPLVVHAVRVKAQGYCVGNGK